MTLENERGRVALVGPELTGEDWLLRVHLAIKLDGILLQQLETLRTIKEGLTVGRARAGSLCLTALGCRQAIGGSEDAPPRYDTVRFECLAKQEFMVEN